MFKNLSHGPGFIIAATLCLATSLSFPPRAIAGMVFPHSYPDPVALRSEVDSYISPATRRCSDDNFSKGIKRINFAVSSAINDDPDHPEVTFKPAGPSYSAFIIYDGAINEEGLGKLNWLLRMHPETRTLVLHSDGGDFFPGKRIAELVKRHHLNTQAFRECYSMCADILESGEKRTVQKGTYIVAHWGSVGGCEKTERSRRSCNLEAKEHAQEIGQRAWKVALYPRSVVARMDKGEDVTLSPEKARRLGMISKITSSSLPDGSSSLLACSLQPSYRKPGYYEVIFGGSPLGDPATLSKQRRVIKILRDNKACQ